MRAFVLIVLAFAGCPFAQCQDQELSLLQLRMGQGSCEGAAPSVPTCAKEVEIRRGMAGKFGNESAHVFTAASFLRMVFHDALDFDNMVDQNGTKVGGGGVDACLLPTQKPGGKPDHNHNRNLDKAGFTLSQLTKKFFPSCDASKPDIQVLAALAALDASGGPGLPMQWGRRQGDCARYRNRVIDVAPRATSFQHDEWRAAFETWGFDAEEQTALMGAHTFGQLHVCAGGFGGVEKANGCTDSSKMRSNAGVEFQDCDTKTRAGAVGCKPVDFRGKAEIADGAFFDMTPMRFDNNYFAMIVEQDVAQENACCGKPKNGAWNEGGRKCSGRGKPDNNLCAHDFCKVNDGTRGAHMVTGRVVAEVPPPTAWRFMNTRNGKGNVKRVIRLGADWSLLKREDTLNHARRFAEDEAAFFAAFDQAFTKLAAKGGEALETCAVSPCMRVDFGFACGEGAEALPFFFGPGCEEAAADGSPGGCVLVGSRGASGVLLCGGQELVCASSDKAAFDLASITDDEDEFVDEEDEGEEDEGEEDEGEEDEQADRQPVWSLVKKDFKCRAKDRKLGTFATVKQCAAAAERSGARFFAYYWGPKAWKGVCLAEHTSSADCPQGFKHKRGYNFYALGTAGN